MASLSGGDHSRTLTTVTEGKSDGPALPYDVRTPARPRSRMVGEQWVFRYAMCRCSPAFRKRTHLGEGGMRRQTRNGRQPQRAPTRLPNDDHSVQRMWRGESLKRRQFGGLLLGVIVAPCITAAQQTAKVLRVGVLAPGPLRPIASFKQRLRELGWIEGSNIRFEDRWGEEDDTRYAALAAELAALPVDVILSWSTPAVVAAKRATAVIPIVIGAVADPVAIGAVASLARPGGNITGFSTQNFEL